MSEAEMKYQNEYEKLKHENNILKYKLQEYKKKEDDESIKKKFLQDSISSYVDKLDFSISFLSFLNCHARSPTDRPGIYGSFLRKMFEFPYLLIDYINNKNLDPNFRSGDIDFYISSNYEPYHYNKILQKIIRDLDLQLGLFLKTKNKEFQPKFGNFFYIGCTNTSEYLNLDIEDAGYTKRLFFSNEIEKIHIDLTSCISQKCFDFSVNSLTMNTEGLKINNKHNFLKYLSQIKNKLTSITSYNFKNTEDLVWASLSPLTRKEKEKNLNRHIIFITKRLLKIYEKGYKLEGSNIPVFEIENKEDCPITSTKAPYPKLGLKCGHSISLMVYMGLINKGRSDYSQAIRCPLCRDDLELKLVSTETIPLFENKLKECLTLGEKSYGIHQDDTIIFSYTNLSPDCLEALNDKD